MGPVSVVAAFRKGGGIQQPQSARVTRPLQRVRHKLEVAQVAVVTELLTFPLGILFWVSVREAQSVTILVVDQGSKGTRLTVSGEAPKDFVAKVKTMGQKSEDDLRGCSVDCTARPNSVGRACVCLLSGRCHSEFDRRGRSWRAGVSDWRFVALEAGLLRGRDDGHRRRTGLEAAG